MKNLTFSTESFLTAALLVLVTGSALATPNPPAAPYTFSAGGTIKASEMNGNFTAAFDAINNISLTPGPQGPTGAQGPAGSSGMTISDAGTYVGQVGLGELANFSMLTGAGGATGTAAANAACASAFPGSHAELNLLALWKKAVNGGLPDAAPAFAYWASTVTDIPVPNGNGVLPRTTDCDNWTNNASGSGGFVRPSIGAGIIDMQIDIQSCSANNMAVACFTP